MSGLACNKIKQKRYQDWSRRSHRQVPVLISPEKNQLLENSSFYFQVPSNLSEINKIFSTQIYRFKWKLSNSFLTGDFKGY